MTTMLTADEVRTKVAALVAECEVKASRFYGVTLAPTIDYAEVKGAKGGIANASRNLIGINMALAMQHGEAFLNQVVPHEYCHLITRRFYPFARQSHGPEWKGVMVRFGQPPVRCHNFDVSAVRGQGVRGQSSRHQMKCNCRTHVVTANRVTKWRRGTPYCCTKCGSRLTYVGPLAA